MNRFLEELKRRNVLRVGAAYAVAGWVIIQIVDATFPDLELPDSLQAVVLWTVISGFPIALLAAWFIGPRFAAADGRGEAGAEEPDGPDVPDQEIRFCVSSDGVRIAYASVGEGPIMVKTANWLNHLEYDWESPVWSHMVHGLARHFQLVRYDERGTGLSDRDVEDISFAGFARDLEAVIDKLPPGELTLFGVSQGCSVAIDYAVRYPERVRRLILYGGFARGIRSWGTSEEIEQRDTVTKLMRTGWGQNNAAFRQIFTSLMLPGATAEQMNWYNELQKRTASPENAIRIRRAIDAIDVMDLLGDVRVPTLVLHCRGDQSVPIERGREMAAGIPGAKFVDLNGQNHLMLESEPAWPRFVKEVLAFTGQSEKR